jgi:hypothetical protein
LAEPDLLSGITFETLHIPVQGGVVIESGDTAAKAAEFMGVRRNGTLALAQGFQGLAGSGYGVGRGEETEESPLEIVPGTGDGEATGSPPGLGVICEIKRRILYPLVSSELNHSIIFLLIVNKVLTCIRVVVAFVRRGRLGFQDLVQSTDHVTVVRCDLSIGGGERGWRGDQLLDHGDDGFLLIIGQASNEEFKISKGRGHGEKVRKMQGDTGQ